MIRLIFIALLLTACHDKEILRGSGEPAMAPIGFYEYCQRNPEAQECGAKK